MGKTQRTYTREFKQQAVQLFETSGKSKTEVARDLGISDSALSKWRKEFGEHGEEAFPGKGHQTAIVRAKIEN
jgi:transposase-like protein